MNMRHVIYIVNIILYMDQFKSDLISYYLTLVQNAIGAKSTELRDIYILNMIEYILNIEHDLINVYW